jgi:hypothetical protein
MQATAPPNRAPTAGANQRLILLVSIALIVAIACAALVARARSHSALNLTGAWTAQDGVVTVNLTLTGSNDHLSGILTTTNAPLPIKGTIAAQVSGVTARVQLRALGQTATAHCAVSSTRMVCTGTGGNKTLTLTFTRP